MKLLVVAALLLSSAVHGQFMQGVFSPQTCLQGHCSWVCPTAKGDCKGLFYCGPKTKSCRVQCPKGGCNAEMALISHSPGDTVVNCVGEAVCQKMLVNCGRVDPFTIRKLNNLPGQLENIFQNMYPGQFKESTHAPYGKCKVNCGWKSCHDLHFLCQGKFKDGAGCQIDAARKPSFENGALHCGLTNENSHCQANCDSMVRGAVGLPPLLNPFGSEPACHNADYFCYQGRCYCDGLGCGSIEFNRHGLIKSGRAPVFIPPVTSFPKTSKPKVTKPPVTSAATTEASVKVSPAAATNTNTDATTTEAMTTGVTTPPRPLRRVYSNYIDAPIKLDFLRGIYTHFRCGTQNCKVLCELPGSCEGLTVLAGPQVKQLTVECSHEGCVGLKVHSNAYISTYKCMDAGACSGAHFTCSSKDAGVVRYTKSCRVDCTNGGCAKHTRHNRQTGAVAELKGLKFECNPGVARCELFADSQNANFGRYGYQYQQGPFYGGFQQQQPPQMPPQSFPQGSFDGGEFVCNVRTSLMAGPGQFYGQQQQNIPTCLLKCSTHISRRYCGGVKYRCGSNMAQCQCQDFCTSHVTECHQSKIKGDCPALVTSKLL